MIAPRCPTSTPPSPRCAVGAPPHEMLRSRRAHFFPMGSVRARLGMSGRPRPRLASRCGRCPPCPWRSVSSRATAARLEAGDVASASARQAEVPRESNLSRPGPSWGFERPSWGARAAPSTLALTRPVVSARIHGIAIAQACTAPCPAISSRTGRFHVGPRDLGECVSVDGSPRKLTAQSGTWSGRRRVRAGQGHVDRPRPSFSYGAQQVPNRAAPLRAPLV